MSKRFREWQPDQRWLLPPSVNELVPPGHVAHFVRDTVRESLDLSAILNAYVEERGFPPYDPTMMTALLLYAYSTGVYSSRRIARACEERVDFMAVTALERPDFRTISDFRKRHLVALGGLFVQVLRLCRKAGLVRLGHVALDGTKVQANASKRKAMSYQRMQQAEPQLAAEVKHWLTQAEAADREDDARYGEARGDEMPDWVASKERRLAKIREAMAALEAEARTPDQPDGDDDPQGPGGKRRAPSAPPADPAAPAPKAQRNFTDPDSKIMKTSDGYVQAYNCQIAVDAQHQIIVAHRTDNQQNDGPKLPALLDGIRDNLGAQAREISADSNYCSEANCRTVRQRRIRGYIATARDRHGQPRVGLRYNGPLVHAMRRKLAQGGHRSRYRLRKIVVEPVFGQIKEGRGFRRFLLRGLHKVPHEWALVCLGHNLRKLAQAA